MNTKDLTSCQLQAYFDEHIRYEFRELLNNAIAIQRKLPLTTRELICLQYAPLEAFVIHLRNLIAFLYPSTKPRPNDVYARNFFDEEKRWESVCPAQSQILKDAKSRADVEIGHLTTLRKNGTPENKMWEVQKLVGEVIPILIQFGASADKINAQFPEELMKSYSLLMSLPNH